MDQNFFYIVLAWSVSILIWLWLYLGAWLGKSFTNEIEGKPPLPRHRLQVQPPQPAEFLNKD